MSIVSGKYRYFMKCESEIILLFLNRYVEGLFEKYWGESVITAKLY